MGMGCIPIPTKEREDSTISGNKIGGQKARNTNISKYGQDFFRRIGALGGKRGTTGGFHYLMLHDPQKLKQIGIKGGSISKRRKYDKLA